MVKDVIDGAAAEELVRERGLVGAGVEGDPLRGSLQVALERDARARLGGVVVKADVTAEGLAEVDVPETEVPLQMQRATTEVQCTHTPETLRQHQCLPKAEFLHPLQGVGVPPQLRVERVLWQVARRRVGRHHQRHREGRPRQAHH